MFNSYRVPASPARLRTTIERRDRRVPIQLESLERRALLAYTITSLGQVFVSPFYSGQGIVAINLSADVAATGGSLGSSPEAYYLNTNGQTTLLPPLSGYSSSTATDVNASGQVAGYSSKNSGGGIGTTINEAVLYNSQGQATDLGNLGGTSQATGIDDSGQVVGYSTTSTAYNAPTHAFLYNGSGKLIDLGTLGGSASYATAISDSGQIVGYSSTGTSSNSPTHAFLMKGSGPISSADDLGVPSGYTSSYATAISSNGVYIAGYATKTVTTSYGFQETVTEPFMYANGQWIDLGNLGGILAEATGINDSGQAVGYSTTTPNSLGGGAQEDAFLYTSSQGVKDLNTQIPSGSKWTLGTATAINDNGVIAGIGGGPDGKYDGFLLYPPTGQSPTPTPTPITPTPTPITPTPTPITPTPTPITPTPPPGPGNPTPGSLHTRAVLTAHPRSAKVGQPVTLIATVKVLGHGRGVPTGSVEFLDGSAILDTIGLGGGKATLRTSSLAVGRDAIVVHYVGAGGFTSSTSGVVIVNIKMPRGPRVDQGSPAASKVPARLIDAE